MSYPIEISQALTSIRQSKKALSENKVIQHEKAIHCELAEWLVAEYLGGIRAKSGNQKGWDIELKDGTKVQVKSHAKAKTNPSNWTILSKHSDGVAEIFIVLFSSELFITTIYRIDVVDAYQMCNAKREVGWKKLKDAGKALELQPFKKQFPFLFK